MPQNPYERRQGNIGKKSERLTAKRMGGRLVPNSGAMVGCKSDFDLAEFKVEAKSTVKDTLPLQLEWLCKVMGEARQVAKQPAVTIAFTTEAGRPRAGGNWVMIPEEIFLQLIAPGE